MAKLSSYVCTALLLMGHLGGFCQYKLTVRILNQDSVVSPENLGMVSDFNNREACTNYINNLPALLSAKGFDNASLDSIRYDSTSAFALLWLGPKYTWASIRTSPRDAEILAAIGWNSKKFNSKPIRFAEMEKSQLQMLDYLENNGFPFGRIFLDSVILNNQKISACLKIDRGPLYHIDSIRIYGNAKVSAAFLQLYLGIPDNMVYSKEKLQGISRRIRELPYVQEEKQWSLTLLGTGSILNLYLKQKKSSQVDILVGVLPSNEQLGSNKVLVTGQATINLKNPFGNGEAIGLDWQQIQVKSPRLNIYYQQPYIFKSPFGINFSFDLFKKDSSYLNVNALLGVQYFASLTSTGTVFIQSTSSSLLNVDSLTIIATRQLPADADVSSVSLGVNYSVNTTNYRFNPLRGNEFFIEVSAGTRTIKENAGITKLIDPNDSSFSFASLYDTVKLKSYEFRGRLAAAHYFQMSRASALKLAVNAGIFQSPNSYRNEIFQIGGYKLLRGFDEESIFASQYVVGTLEYHYLIAQNSFLFSFLDYGWARNNVPDYSLDNSYLGLGLGLAFETKAGIFNISYAVGKRNDTSLNMRAAKIHLGYVNFF